MILRSVTIAACLSLFACAASAQRAGATRAVCEAAPTLVPGRVVRGSTEGAPDRFHASCARESLSGDRVYRLRLVEDARVTLAVEATYDVSLYVRRGCDDPVTELACDDDDAAGSDHASLALDLTAGTYFVFVDGYDVDSAGSFALAARVEPTAPRVALAGELRWAQGRRVAFPREVEAVDAEGEVVARGAVDGAGRFSLRVPPRSRLRVRAVGEDFDVRSAWVGPGDRRWMVLTLPGPQPEAPPRSDSAMRPR